MALLLKACLKSFLLFHITFEQEFDFLFEMCCAVLCCAVLCCAVRCADSAAVVHSEQPRNGEPTLRARVCVRV